LAALQIVPALRELDACPDGGCWLWPSITQRSYQTAEILASLLGTGYSRIVPEYSFLDPRYEKKNAGATPATLMLFWNSNPCCCPSQRTSHTLSFCLGMLWSMSHRFDISLHLLNLIQHLLNFLTTIIGMQGISHWTAEGMERFASDQLHVVHSLLCDAEA